MRHDDHLFPILPEPHRVTPGRPAARHGRAAIAIGAANGANPIAIVVPCHRVIATSGDLKGYAWGLHRKRKHGFPLPIEGLARRRGMALPQRAMRAARMSGRSVPKSKRSTTIWPLCVNFFLRTTHTAATIPFCSSVTRRERTGFYLLRPGNAFPATSENHAFDKHSGTRRIICVRHIYLDKCLFFKNKLSQ